jgi:ApaG protein
MSSPELSCSVKVSYLDEQSQPAAGVFAFAYTVTIVNSGDITAQLVARHWTVTDAMGHVEEVRGLAVVGHQPLLKPASASSTRAGRASPRPRARCAARTCA